jgi:sugar lactone lactonase YvrE
MTHRLPVELLAVLAFAALVGCTNGSVQRSPRTTATTASALLPDPCLTNNGGCDANTVCLNSPNGTARCACSGCGPLALATGQANPYNLTVSGSTVYWADIDSGAIVSAPVAGGAATTILSGLFQPAAVAVDGATIYWTSGDGSISKAATSGGAVTTLVPPGAGAENDVIKVSNGQLYWTSLDDGTLSTVSVNGGAVTTLASGRSSPFGLAVDATNAYWADSDSGVIASVPLTGGAVTTIATAQAIPVGVAVSATDVYWTDYTTGSIVTAPIAGGSPTTLTTGSADAFGIAIDSGNVYWTTITPDTGTVMTMSLGGGTPATLATNRDRPLWIAVDSNDVYWVQRSGDVLELGLSCGSGQCQCRRGTSATGSTCADDCTVSNGGCASTAACSHVPADNSVLCTECGAQTPCTGHCVSLDFDTANCGACGTACDPDQSCESGQCATTTDACGRIVNLDTDATWTTDGFTFNGHTGGASTTSGNCAGGGPEIAMTFTVPTTGYVSLTTEGGQTNFDTVLYVRTDCADDTTELDCSNDTATSTASSLDLPNVSAGTVLTVFVDGYAGAAGLFTLKAHFGACPGGQDSCGAACVNLQTDETNCGTCGTTCASGEICTNGVCTACNIPQTICSGACVSVRSDPNNCGTCSHVCSSGTCTGGFCNPSCAHLTDLSTVATWTTAGFTYEGDTTNAPGLTSGTCAGSGPENAFSLVMPAAGSITLTTAGGSTNFNTVLYARRSCDDDSTELSCDEQSDGTSTITLNNLASGEAVTVFVDGYGGASGPYTLTGTLSGCTSDFTECSSACVNTQTSAANCSMCGNACPTDNVCNAGVCQACADGQHRCGDVCSDQQTDVHNCGACGNVCASDNICLAGVCSPPVDVCQRLGDLNATATWTGDTFTIEGDTQGASTTSSDCGGSGPENGYTILIPTSGVLTLSTDNPNTTVDSIVSVRDTCGGTELGCGFGSVSIESVTAGSTLTVLVDGFGGSFGHYTLTGRITPCLPGLDQCGSACADLQADPTNCGVCGTACGTTETCTSGACVACASGESVCDNTCVDEQTDSSNCGACGTACNSGDACTNGQCQTTPDVCTRLENLNTTATWTATGFTIDGATHGASTSSGTCATSDGPENGYTLTVPSTGDVTLTTLGGQTNFDTVLYVQSSCGGTELGCNDDVMSGTRPSTVTLTNVAAGTVLYVIVDGYLSSGSYTLTGALNVPTCGSGEVLCSGVCSNPKNDTHNCGSCGLDCSTGQTCNQGTCSATPDGGSTDAGTDAGSTDAGSTDAGSTDAGSIDAGSTDAGSTDAGSTDAGFAIGSTDAGTTTPPQTTPRSGCGCSSPTGSLPGVILLAQALAAMVLRRNRRRASVRTAD